MSKLTKIAMLAVLVALLVCVRLFEDLFFYDPLLLFFKTNHSPSLLPDFDSFKLLANIFLRYVLNSLISLAILWVVFKDKGILKLSGILYVLFFVLLFVAFIILVFSSESSQHMTLFYVRRFLIQPLFLLILLPAFYFQLKKS